MKTYIFFDTISGIVARITAKNIDDAITQFEKFYPHRSFCCVYER